MLRKILFVNVLFCPLFSSYAQEVAVNVAGTPAPETPPSAKPKLTFSGSADVYYRFELAQSSTNNLTSFTNSHNAFSLGMASFKLEHQSEKLDLVADFGLGTRAKEFSYTDEGILSSVKQLYVSYLPNNWLKLTAGTWATHVGYELVDPQLNRNYSMSYMFTNGPFHHTGVKAEITKGKSGLMVGFSNATDYRIPQADHINRKFLLAQYSLAFTDDIKLFVNYVGGKNPDTSKTSQVDAVVTAKFSKVLSLGYNGTVNTTHSWTGIKSDPGKSWWGSALYLNWDPQSRLGFTLREELFSDSRQLKMFAAASQGGQIWATTLSAQIKAGGLLVIPEFRIDRASASIYANKNGKAQASTASFLVAAIYSF